jgi:hypothetical protein
MDWCTALDSAEERRNLFPSLFFFAGAQLLQKRSSSLQEPTLPLRAAGGYFLFERKYPKKQPKDFALWNPTDNQILLAFPRSLRPTGFGQGAKTTFVETNVFLRIPLECAAVGAYNAS